LRSRIFQAEGLADQAQPEQHKNLLDNKTYISPYIGTEFEEKKPVIKGRFKRI